MSKNFRIVEIEKEGEAIAVTLDGGQVVTLSTAEFHSFLIRNDRLDYTSDTQKCGEHIQFTGTLSLDEYWDADTKYIEPDVYDFIIAKKIPVQNPFKSLAGSIASIVRDFGPNAIVNQKHAFQ